MRVERTIQAGLAAPSTSTPIYARMPPATERRSRSTPTSIRTIVSSRTPTVSRIASATESVGDINRDINTNQPTASPRWRALVEVVVLTSSGRDTLRE